VKKIVVTEPITITMSFIVLPVTAFYHNTSRSLYDVLQILNHLHSRVFHHFLADLKELARFWSSINS
jgi:hypothetical protein